MGQKFSKKQSMVYNEQEKRLRQLHNFIENELKIKGNKLELSLGEITFMEIQHKVSRVDQQMSQEIKKK